MKPSKFLTARSTVIALFSAISAALLVASSLPQRSTLSNTPPEWVGRLPDSLHFLTNLLGLDYIVGSAWFAVLVALFWLSLVISTISQYTANRTTANRIPSATLPPESIRLDMPLSSCSGLVQEAGYHPAGSADGVHRYVKNRLGYWGNFLLHIGLVTAVLFSLVYVLTQHRVLIRLTGQEITRLTPRNVQELHGVLPLKQSLPYSVVLKDLIPRFWPNDKLEYLSSELYFTDQAGGEPQRVDIAVSDKSQYGRYIVYQANVYGRAFDIEFESADGPPRRERFYIPYPSRRDVAGYGELPLTGTDFLVKGKFYADPDHKSISLNPSSPLTLRLHRGKELLSEVTVTPGGKAQLGPFGIRLAQSQWWTDILLDGTLGTGGIFAGFALILAGVLSSYCLVPREIIVRESGGGIYVQHVVRRFAQFYREEYDELIQKARNRREL